MPATSERQRRTMWAASSGHSRLGIPQEVGKEFVTAGAAAGVVYSTPDGLHLLAKRGDGARDFPGCWSVPGGMVEAGETHRDAAAREFSEETGHAIDPAELVHLGSIDGFSVFHAVGPRFVPDGDGENSAFEWAGLTFHMEHPSHPGLADIMSHPELRLVSANELDVARMIAAGEVASPTLYGNVWLFDMRITGTGVCYRAGNDEFAWRDPAQYLTDEFIARCNGLPVIWEHPGDGLLDTDEFRDRVIGSIMLPYVKGDEVWGVAKIHDAEAAGVIVAEQRSTSPSVVTSGDAKLTLSDGSDIVLEGKPKMVDHLAVCRKGVWDKGGEPAGISTNHEVTAMADEPNDVKPDADDKLSRILDSLEGLSKRMDSYEGKKADEAAAAKAKADAEAEEAAKKADEDKAKADADVAARIRDLEGRIPATLNAEEADKLAAAQAKADSVFGALGESAPRPLAGETADGYRRRYLGKLKSHSKQWADVDLAKADSAVLNIAETAIHADAIAASNAPANIGAGRLMPRTRRTGSGHVVTEYAGDVAGYLSSFAAKSSRLVGFRTKGA